MAEADWDFGRFGMQLTDGVLNENDELGHPRKSDSVFLLFNAHHEDVRCLMPPTGAAKFWKLRLTTADAAGPVRVSGHHGFKLQARSVALLITAPPVPFPSAEPEAPVKTDTEPPARKGWFSKVRSRISPSLVKD